MRNGPLGAYNSQCSLLQAPRSADEKLTEDSSHWPNLCRGPQSKHYTTQYAVLLEIDKMSCRRRWRTQRGTTRNYECIFTLHPVYSETVVGRRGRRGGAT